MNAESHVAAFETLPLGSEWATSFATTTAACAAEWEAAAAELCPYEITPTPADAIAMYGAMIADFRVSSFGEDAARAHGRSIHSWPALAALFRSQECLADVAAAAGSLAVPMNELETIGAAKAKAAAKAVALYQLAIARQIAGVPEHSLAPAARALLAAEALAPRLEAARGRQEAHAAAELERAAAERRAAAEAAQAERKRKVDEAHAAAAAARLAEQHARETARRARGESLAARLADLGEHSGLADPVIRFGDRVLSIADLVRTAPHLSNEQLAGYERTLALGEYTIEGWRTPFSGMSRR